MKNYPITVPLRKNEKITAILSTAFGLIMLYGVWLLNTKTIYVGDEGEIMSGGYIALLSVVFGVAGAGYLFLALNHWQRIIFNRGAMTLDRDGVYDTFVWVGIFAFRTAVPVKFIPWNALEAVEDDPFSYKVHTEMIPKERIGAIPRFVLKYNGFVIIFANITKEEFQDHIDSCSRRN